MQTYISLQFFTSFEVKSKFQIRFDQRLLIKKQGQCLEYLHNILHFDVQHFISSCWGPVCFI